MAQKTFADLDVLTASDINTYLSHEGGAWTSWTPVISQGASVNITKTVVYSTYAREGRKITWNFRFDMTAAGSAGSSVTLTLPVTLVGGAAGVGAWYDASTFDRYVAMWDSVSTTEVALLGDTGYVGVTPSVAIGSGDQIKGCIVYEAAT